MKRFLTLLFILTVQPFSARSSTANLTPIPITGAVADIAYDTFTRSHFIATTSATGVTTISALAQDPVALGPVLVQGNGPAIIEPDGIGGLYVLFQNSRTIIRHDITAGTNAQAFTFNTEGTAENMRIISAEDRLISVVRHHAFPGVMDTALFRNGVAVPNPLLYNIVRGVEPGGRHAYSSIAGINKLTVTTNGLEVALAIPSSLQDFNPGLTVTGNKVIIGNGLITDLDLRPIATVPGAPAPGVFAIPSRVFADPRTNVIAFSWRDRLGPIHLVLYDPATDATKLDVVLPIGVMPEEIFPWGSSSYGLRLIDTGQGHLYLVDVQGAPEADLSLAVTRSSEAATHLQPVTYTVTLSNNGPDTAEDVTVAHELNFGLTLRSATPSIGQADPWANDVPWRVGTLAPGQSATLVIEATAGGPAFGFSKTWFTFSGIDLVPTNNAVTNVIPIAAPLTAKGATFQFPLTHVAANRQTGDLYVANPSSRGPFPYSVIRWNPEANTMEQIAAYPVQPGLLTLSDNNRYLFVALTAAGQLEQIDLSGQVDPIRFPFGLNAPIGDLDALPNTPASVIASSAAGSKIFDDGIPRPNAGPGGVIAVLSDTTAFQFRTVPIPFSNDLFTLSFSQEGINALSLPNPHLRGHNQIHAAAGKIFTEAGLVLNPDTGALVTTLDTDLTPSWAFDEAADHFYILSHDTVKWTLKRYSISTLSKLAEIPVPAPKESVTGLVQFGPDKFAYKTANFITVLREPPFANTDVALSSTITPSPSGTSAESFVWNLTITNRGSQIASNISIIATVTGPELAVRPIEDATGNYPNPFTRIVPILAPGESHTLSLAITSFHGGRYLLSARAERFGADSDFLNNAVVEEFSFAPEAGIIRTYTIALNDIDFDKTSGRLIMTPSSFMQGLQTSLLALDLNTYSLHSLLRLDATGTMLAVSDADAAGVVMLERANPNLVGFSATPARVGAPFASGGLMFDMAMRPGTTNVLIASSGGGTHIYTNDIPYQLDTPSAIAFDPQRPNDLFLYHNQNRLTRIDLSLPTPAKTSNLIAADDPMYIAAINGRIIFADGRTADQTTLQLIESLPGIAANQTPGFVAADHSANRIYLYFDGQPLDRLEIYDATTFLRIGGLSIEGIAKPLRLRAHNNHLAVLDRPPNSWETYNVQIFDIPATNIVDLAASSPAVRTLEDLTTTLNITVSNNSPWAATNAILELQFPTNFVFNFYGGTNSYELISDGIRVTISQLQNGSPTIISLSGKFLDAGTNTFTGAITSASPELNAQNNQLQFTATIFPLPTLTIPSPYFAAAEGSHPAFRFGLSHPVPLPVSFLVTLTNGTADVLQTMRPPTNLTRVVNFLVNSTNAVCNFNHDVLQNTNVDGPRTLTALLSNPTNLNLTIPSVTLNLIDDEGPPRLSVNLNTPFSEALTNRTYSIRPTRSPVSNQPSRYQYAFVSDTATAGEDFIATSGTIEIPAGTNAGPALQLTILADVLAEGPETVTLEFTAVENLQLLTNYVRITFADNAPAPAPANHITSVTAAESRAKIQFTTARDGRYRILRAPEITSIEWTPVGDVILHSTGLAELFDPQPPTSPTSFYRLERRQ